MTVSASQLASRGLVDGWFMADIFIEAALSLPAPGHSGNRHCQVSLPKAPCRKPLDGDPCDERALTS